MTRDLTNILSYLEFDEVKPFFAVELLFESGTELGTNTTSLTADINASQTTLAVESVAGYFSAGTFTIGSEQITYTGISDLTFTGLTRGFDGTTAASHSSGATVTGGTIISAPLYFWTGTGDTTIDGITYIGTGTLMQISSIKETAEIQAAGATLTISGIPADLLSLALSVPYQGRIGKIKFGLIDADNNLLELESAFNMLAESGIDIGLESVDQSNVLVDMFVGYMDQMNINEGSETSTISLSLESKLLDLDRPVVRRYNNESQKAFFPNDKAFEFLNDLQSKDLSWGRASETT
tara:strand:- start:1867 stop:2751 length:885 start_codon:yes stop_codon:yes gene_type:complete